MQASDAALLRALVSQRLLAAVTAAVGMAGAASTGVIRDLVVWIIYPHGH